MSDQLWKRVERLEQQSNLSGGGTGKFVIFDPITRESLFEYSLPGDAIIEIPHNNRGPLPTKNGCDE